MSPTLLAIAGPIVLVLVAVVVSTARRRKKKKAKAVGQHRRTTIYDASLREKAATAEARDRAKRSSREASALRAKVTVLERANLEVQGENARLHRKITALWDQVTEQARELGNYRDEDTVEILDDDWS